MTVWNDSGYTDRLAHANWMANTAVLMHLNERATGDPARDWLSSWAHRWFVGDRLRVLVLGCGEGWLERAIAAWPFVERIDAVDFAEGAVARARELGRGVDKIRYGVLDLNREAPETGVYDVVVAHSVIHHVENLEHAYAAIDRSMRPEATLIVNEYAGPNRFQFSDDVLTIMNLLLRCIPRELRGGLESRTRPTVEEMIANDPTEAVRSAEIVDMTARHFEILERIDIGGTVLQHLLYEIATRFHFEVPRERSIIEILCTIEAMLVDSGRLPSDFVLLACRKRGSRVTKASRPLPPRAEGANDIESDPLRGTFIKKGRRGPSVHPSSPRFWKPALRILRLALLSGQERRANLHRESRLLGWRERLRAGGRDPWEWVEQRAPDDEAIRCLIRAAATLARA